ncbi:MFS general substrate transporter [Aspergillus japonicus CBS 114.51]|uniref:MFS general substrate transporter n=1 Tax=Aspergillus japonicus CBS 114.51 TaxID=1448312 RepID=A0A8T8X4J0_ASPJA|nr:MFS general substrate transporter [Aspergillus japonicus CBS 114.51]RAH82850.1 MFS general substrate transporter [Aspergillus japonicus CBS 114.51]
MSLVQHVSAIEGADREPDPHDDSTITTAVTSEHYGSIRRKISYDFFPPPPPPIEEELHSGTPAYKVPTATRLAQVAVTILACWFAAGIVFGFAALKPVLIAEGVYRDLCTDEELRDGVDVCVEQDLRLNFFFTVSSITANVSALPVGTILDRYGSRVCGFAGCVLLAIGCVLMAYSFSEPGFDGYIAANFFLALGGTFIFVPSFQIANAFPKYAGTIVALVTGAFDASAAVYLFYRLAYDATDRSFTPQSFFTGYLLVPVLIFIALITIMPARDYQSAHQLEIRIEKAEDATRDVHDSDDDIESDSELLRIRRERAKRRLNKIHKIDEVLGDRDERLQREHHEEERQATSAVWGALHGQPAHKQMLTPWFVLITLMTVLQMLRMNYFIATIYAQYEYMLQSAPLAAQINGFFDVALPVGGVVSTPFIGMLLDNLSVPSILSIIVVLTTVIGIFNSIPVLWTGYVTVTLFVLLRPLYYSAMSDYATKVFGFATFGRVYGTIICFSGLVNFSQYGLDALTHGPFDGNPIPINIFFAGAGFVVGTALVAFVYFAGRHMKEEQRDMEESGERQWLIPEESEEDVYGSTR